MGGATLEGILLERDQPMSSVQENSGWRPRGQGWAGRAAVSQGVSPLHRRGRRPLGREPREKPAFLHTVPPESRVRT